MAAEKEKEEEGGGEGEKLFPDCQQH